jgi:acetylserotonin N-methyltransferase
VTYELPPTEDRPIWDTWLSMHHLPSVTVADELGIFRSLHESPAGAVELAARLGYDRRTTIAVMRMLAALGYLTQRLGVYQVTDAARLYLLKESPYYWGHMLGNRTNLHDTLKERLQGRSPAGIPGHRGDDRPGDTSASGWASGQIDLERGRRIAAAMHSHSLPAATGLARTADFSAVRRLLDVGAGSGCYPIALARANPSLRATIMELPAMCAVAKEYIAAGGVADRVDTLAVDMFREPWPKGYDAVFFANVWHDWNFETCAFLAKQTYDALPTGGRIFLHEMLLDDDGDGPVTTVGFSMLMLGTEGQQFTLPELQGLLEAARFSDVQSQHTYGYYSLVSALKG